MTKRLMILLALLLLSLAFYLLWKKYLYKPSIVVSRNEIIKSNYDFIAEHWKEEKLLRLKENENFKDIAGRDQLDLFLKLCNWTHNQWQHSIPDPYPLCNAIDILSAIRSGKTGGFCGQYSYVLADVLKSLGFFAVRYVELTDNNGDGHFVVEVWSDQFAKWMILDPDQNIYYEFSETGIPANAYEIRKSFLKKDHKVIARRADNQREKIGDHYMSYYANFAVSLRSDLMRHTHPLTFEDRYQMFLFYKDDRTMPSAFKGKKIPYLNITSRLNDIYFDCNCVRVNYKINREKKTIEFTFLTDGSVFNFKNFMLSFDSGKSWTPSDYQYSLSINQKPQTIFVAPLNQAGRIGTITTILVNP